MKYRRAGRYSLIEHAGTFKTQRDALTRKQKVGEWLAAGDDPKRMLRRSLEPPVSMKAACDAWVGSRRSVSSSTRANYRAKVGRIVADLDVAPADLEVADVNAWVGGLADEYKPGTVALFVSVLRQVIDHADVSPNVARDRRVELPRRERGEVRPPDAGEFLAVLQRTNRRYRLVVVLLEQTGMRVSEAVTLEWGDVDVGGCRLRVSAARSKTGRARWVEVGDWLMEVLGPTEGTGITDTIHPPPKVGVAQTSGGRALGQGAVARAAVPALRVFPGMTRQKVYNALRAGCVAANVAPFGPHALRHRRASILHNQISAARAAAILGHSTAEHLRTYAHVMPVDEVPVEDLVSALT